MCVNNAHFLARVVMTESVCDAVHQMEQAIKDSKQHLIDKVFCTVSEAMVNTAPELPFCAPKSITVTAGDAATWKSFIGAFASGVVVGTIKIVPHNMAMWYIVSAL